MLARALDWTRKLCARNITELESKVGVFDPFTHAYQYLCRLGRTLNFFLVAATLLAILLHGIALHCVGSPCGGGGGFHSAM